MLSHTHWKTPTFWPKQTYICNNLQTLNSSTAQGESKGFASLDKRMSVHVSGRCLSEEAFTHG